MATTTDKNVAEFLDAYRACPTEPKFCTLKAGTKPRATYKLYGTPIWSIVDMISKGFYSGVERFA